MPFPYTIREIKPSEFPVLETMLYEAVFQLPGKKPYPREIIKKPEIYAYIEEFGTRKDDHCLIAETDGKIIGAVWTRIMAHPDKKGYGNVDDETPEFAISLLKEFRNQGIGTELMERMLLLLKGYGYKQVSLSVDKANYAVRLYKKLGFQITGENKEDYIMLLQLT